MIPIEISAKECRVKQATNSVHWLAPAAALCRPFEIARGREMNL